MLGYGWVSVCFNPHGIHQSIHTQVFQDMGETILTSMVYRDPHTVRVIMILRQTGELL